MHIAIDGKRYFLNTSGLGRYSRTLVKYLLLQHFESELTITLLKPKGKERFPPFSNPNLHLKQIEHTLPGDLGNGLWRYFKLPRIISQEHYSLFHGPSHILPLRARCPLVVTMFDLIFLRYPRYFRLWDRTYYRVLFNKSAQRADHIISISEATKSDLINYFGIPEEKISVIYPAFDVEFAPLSEAALEAVRTLYSLPTRYVLYVGTIEPRKNILRIAQAVDQLISEGLIDKSVQLLLVGNKGWFYKDIFSGLEQLKNKDNIRLVGPVFGKELAGIYQLASVLAYPSLFEGFGYPVIEAMRLGTPVLTSNISSLPEAGGNAALLVDPKSTSDIAQGLAQLINDEDMRTELIRKGYEHSSRFSAPKMALQTMEIYKRITS